MAQEKREILIKIDTRDAGKINDISKSLGLLNSNTKSLAGGMRVLTGAFSGWLGFLGVSELTRMSDEIQNVSNRLKIITGSTEGAQEALQKLASVADRTNQGLAATGDIYSRLAISLRGAKATTGEILTLTESLINTFRVSGATTTETTNTIIQLSQAFASGELRGQELRSVMEQNATLAGLLRERFGKDIYKDAQKGLISVTEVLRVLAENQQKVNEDAKKLAPTFEQVLTKATNRISLAIGQLNEKYQLSAKFAVALDFAMGGLAEALTVVGGVAIAVAISKIPVLISQLKVLWGTIQAFALSNPVTASLVAIATVGTLAYLNWDRIDKKIRQIRAFFLDLLADFREFQVKFHDVMGFNDKIPEVRRGREDSVRQALEARKAARDIRQQLAMEDLARVQKADAEDPVKQMQSLIDKIGAMGGKVEKVKKLKEILSELNTSFLKGEITQDQYNQKLIQFNLDKVKREFKEGKTDILKFHEEMRDLNIEDLNRKFAQGTITLDKFNQSVDTEKFKVLKEQMEAGKISVQQFNEEVNKLESRFSDSSPITVGVNRYMTSIGSLADNISNGIQKTLSAMEDGIVQFVKTGKINFKDFADTVIEEIIRIQVRMAIAGIISSIVGSFASSGSGATDYGGQPYSNPNVAYAANGGIMTSKGMMPLHTYATGGIAKSPQMAVFGEGRMPEAYVPLPDGRSIPVNMKGGGDTNNVVVNVNASTGEEDSTSTTQKAQMLGERLAIAIRKVLVEEKRSGGILTK